MAWPTDWDRGHVLGALEEATRQSIHADDPLPDTLIAKSQELGLLPAELKLWIYDSPNDWTVDTLTRWARQYGLNRREKECS